MNVIMLQHKLIIIKITSIQILKHPCGECEYVATQAGYHKNHINTYIWTEYLNISLMYLLTL